MAGSKVANNFWRMAGLSYLQYLNVSSHVLRSSLKEPAQSRALGRQVVFYNRTVKDVKTPIKSLLPK
jgi:hypothetical protein